MFVCKIITEYVDISIPAHTLKSVKHAQTQAINDFADFIGTPS